MIRLQKDQMVMLKADYKAMKANADSWLAREAELKTAKPTKPAAKSKSTPTFFKGDR